MKNLQKAAMILALAACPAAAQNAQAPAAKPAKSAPHAKKRATSAGGPAAAASLQTDDQKALYVLGARLGDNISELGLSASELALVTRGLDDAAMGRKLLVDPSLYSAQLQAFARKRLAAHVSVQKREDHPFYEKAKARAQKTKGGQVLPSGVLYIPIAKGKGKKPLETDRVTVDYEGKLADGKVFDSSYKRGTPATFPLKGVIPCWTQGVQLMRPGGEAELVCPPAAAYGDQGRPPTIPGGATLDFKVKLIRVAK